MNLYTQSLVAQDGFLLRPLCTTNLKSRLSKRILKPLSGKTRKKAKRDNCLSNALADPDFFGKTPIFLILFIFVILWARGCLWGLIVCKTCFVAFFRVEVSTTNCTVLFSFGTRTRWMTCIGQWASELTPTERIDPYGRHHTLSYIQHLRLRRCIPVNLIASGLLNTSTAAATFVFSSLCTF